jgi:hypothetical protein
MGSYNPIGADNQQETGDGILRDCTRGATGSIGGEDTVRSSWRHGEPGRNDLATRRNVRSNNMPKVAKFLVG